MVVAQVSLHRTLPSLELHHPGFGVGEVSLLVALLREALAGGEHLQQQVHQQAHRTYPYLHYIIVTEIAQWMGWRP